MRPLEYDIFDIPVAYLWKVGPYGIQLSLYLQYNQTHRLLYMRPETLDCRRDAVEPLTVVTLESFNNTAKSSLPPPHCQAQLRRRSCNDYRRRRVCRCSFLVTETVQKAAPLAMVILCSTKRTGAIRCFACALFIF